MTRGRPAAFDRDTALQQAMLVFWQHGYETTSIANLSAAMGINASSLYAAFADKRSLFRAVVQHYLAGPASATVTALNGAGTARVAVGRLLRTAAASYTTPGRPPGCLVINGAANCSPQTADVQAELRVIRQQGQRAIEQRIAAGIHDGDVPAGTDVPALARFYTTVIQGMSSMARDGASRTELGTVVDAALAAWPRSRRTSARSSRLAE